MTDLAHISPHTVFDGGELDCGSGLILLLREHIGRTPVGGILEMRSREPSVADDLPPWCRMTGHQYLGCLEGEGFMRYFLRRGEPTGEEDKELESDKKSARQYEYRLRARSSGPLHASVYARNHAFELGQAASFKDKDAYPCGLEYLLGSLAGALASSFSNNCARHNLEADDIEISLKGELHNILAHLGLEEGDPGLKRVELRCYVSSFDDETALRNCWQTTLRQCPVFSTLSKSAEITEKLVIV